MGAMRRTGVVAGILMAALLLLADGMFAHAVEVGCEQRAFVGGAADVAHVWQGDGVAPEVEAVFVSRSGEAGSGNR